MSTRHTKLFIVLDAEILDRSWSESDLRQNVPDFVGLLCGRNPSAGDGPMTAYVLSDPTVYTDLADFDDDRSNHRDHFRNLRTRPYNLTRADIATIVLALEDVEDRMREQQRATQDYTPADFANARNDINHVLRAIGEPHPPVEDR